MPKKEKSNLFTKSKKLLGDELYYLLGNALKTTLNTVKISSNLTPVQSAVVRYHDTNKSILIPINNYLSINWAIFVINRTFSHNQFHKKYLITTYSRDEANGSWLLVYKLTSKQHKIFFENTEKYKAYMKLGANHKELVTFNIYTRNERSGNCQMLTQTLCYFIWKYAIKLNSNLIKSIEILSFKTLDHVFIIINRNPKSLLNDHKSWDGIIVDPWKGIQSNPSIFHSKKFRSYYETLRIERPDIIVPDTTYSLDVDLFTSLRDLIKPANIKQFNKIDDLISHGKVELMSGKQSTKPKYLAQHQSRFFAVLKQLEHSEHPKDTIRLKTIEL